MPTEKNYLILFIAAIVAAAAFLGLIYYLNVLGWFVASEVRLAMVVILGTLLLLSALTLVSVIFSYRGLGNRDLALGLPEGSVRSIIALSLIIIFVIVGIYMFQRINTPLTELDANTLFWDGREFVNVTKKAYVQLPPNEAYVDFAQDMMTTIGTLVVALAGFYFGTRAVEVAKGRVDRTLTILTPTESPHTLTEANEELIITLMPSPEEESITWETPPQGTGTLIQYEPNKFKYNPGPEAKGKTVKLNFRLSRYPDVKATLEVIVPNTS